MARKKTHEEFVAEVKALVGDEYTVVGRYTKALEKIKIKHTTCGNTFETRANNFLGGSGCAKCNGIIPNKKTSEEFAAEVMELVGNEYKIISEYVSSSKKIKMEHTKCGITYETSPNNFLKGRRCPTCYTIKSKTHGEFVWEIKKLVGSSYKVMSEYTLNYKKLKMKHLGCGMVYEVRPNAFLRGARCPLCKQSKGETKITDFLKRNYLDYTCQKSIRCVSNKYPLYLDFYVHGIAIEYDGIQHFEPVDHFGGECALAETQRRDRIKDKYCADNGIPLIRIPYWDFDNIDAILTEKLLPLLAEKNAC